MNPSVDVLGRGAGFGPHRVLMVDDEESNRSLWRRLLEPEGISCAEAADGVAAMKALAASRYDLVLLDIDLPKMKGTEVLRRLREAPPSAHLKVIMLSGRASGDDMAQMMQAGADDFLAKPFTIVQFLERVQAALRMKDVQDRSDLLNRHLRTVNHELEATLAARNSDLVQARNVLVLSLAEIVACRDAETGAHLLRVQRYCRCLADAAASAPGFADEIDADFIALLECCAPLHDIGKIGVPDQILLKPGKLNPEERLLMQRHTVIAAEMLGKVASRHPFAVGFLHMAIDIARHHHERYDGTGYPDRLRGDAIPLAARILSLADVYDALRSRRVYKAPLSHAAAIEAMTEGSGHFDPALLAVFRQRCASEFERLFHEIAD